MALTVPMLSLIDKQRLEPLVHPELAPSWPILRLRGLLEAARIVAPERVPANLVTMNSRIRIRDLQRDETESLTLAYPESAPGVPVGSDDPASASTRVSVISPLGAALLGARVGGEASWIGPRGPRRVRVEALEFQPEKAGRYDL